MDGKKSKIIYFISTPNTKSFVVPGSVTDISAYSFLGCEYLLEVIISDGKINRIGFEAFRDCVNLRRIVLPKSLQTIEKDAFLNCNNIVCGGLFLNPNLKKQAEDAGIQPLPLSDGCLNNYNAFVRKETCKKCHNEKLYSLCYILVSMLSS